MQPAGDGEPAVEGVLAAPRQPIVQQRRQLDRPVALDAVSGAVDHVHLDGGLSAAGLDYVVVVDHRRHRTTDEHQRAGHGAEVLPQR